LFTFPPGVVWTDDEPDTAVPKVKVIMSAAPVMVIGKRRKVNVTPDGVAFVVTVDLMLSFVVLPGTA
jgi:hypothetical protein